MFEKLKSFFGTADTGTMKNEIKKETKNEVSAQEKKQALLKAVQFWQEGRYERATELCRRYNISDGDFAKAQIAYSRIQPSSVTDEEKEKAVVQAVYLWQQGKYQRAVELYKRYGISDRDFTRYMVAGLNQEKGK